MVNVHLFKGGLAVLKAALKFALKKLLNRSFFIARSLQAGKKIPRLWGKSGKKIGVLSLLYEDASIFLQLIIGKADFRIMCVLVV